MPIKIVDFGRERRDVGTVTSPAVTVEVPGKAAGLLGRDERTKELGRVVSMESTKGWGQENVIGGGAPIEGDRNVEIYPLITETLHLRLNPGEFDLHYPSYSVVIRIVHSILTVSEAKFYSNLMCHPAAN